MIVRKECKNCKKVMKKEIKNELDSYRWNRKQFCSSKCRDKFRYVNPILKQKNKEQRGKYYLLNKDRELKNHKEWIKNNKDKQKEIDRRYRKNNPQKNYSRTMARKKIVIEGLCKVCNKELAQHRHHKDYFKPYDITFVCRKCHNDIHKGRIKWD